MSAAKTHMRREVEEVPEAVARLLDRAGADLATAGEALARVAPPVLATVARGSSDHAASYLKYATEFSAGVPVGLGRPLDRLHLRRAAQIVGRRLLAISQSGKSRTSWRWPRQPGQAARSP